MARSFEREGLRTNALHGDKSQDERLKALEAFKRGEVDVLVATDVAARGLDIADLPAVFNFDVPFNAEDYVHRIGRTGRAGASGLAVTLVTRDDARLIADIEKLIKKKIDLEPIELNDERPAREPRRRETSTADEAPRRASAPTYARPSAPSVSRDPFFDRPYEPSSSVSTTTADAPTPSARGASPNIKPKKKVAALFGAKRTEESAG